MARTGEDRTKVLRRHTRVYESGFCKSPGEALGAVLFEGARQEAERVSKEWVRLWKRGYRRFMHLPEVKQRVAKRVVRAILRELESCKNFWDLVKRYGGDNGWCLKIAQRRAPDDPWAWNLALVEDAAYAIRLNQLAQAAKGED